jgi:hypothetical protein
VKNRDKYIFNPHKILINGAGVTLIRKYLLLIMLSSLALWGRTQSNLSFYHASDQFNASNFNPAFLSSPRKYTFSIFPFSGMSFYYNNQVVIKDVMGKFLDDNISTESFKKVFNSMVKQELFFLNYETNLLNFTYRPDFGAFSFRIKENVVLLSDFKGNLSDFLMDQEAKSLAIGEPQLFAAEALHYREYSLGFSKALLHDKFTIGARAKVYFGKSILFSEVSANVTMKADTFYTQFSGPMKLSIPADPLYHVDGYLQDLNLAKNFDLGNYITNAKNVGFGIDLGFSYSITPKIEFSASVTDLGWINWKENINSLMFNEEIPFPASNIDVKINEDGVPVLTKFNVRPLADSISFQLMVNRERFSKPLPTNLFAGFKYQLNPKLTVGFVDRLSLTKGLSHNSFSLTANYRFNEKWTVITGYSAFGNSFNNIPLSFLYKASWGQSYFGSDNLFALLIPSVSEFSGISFGTSFYLFRKNVKYKDEIEYLPFYMEKKQKPNKRKGLVF